MADKDNIKTWKERIKLAQKFQEKKGMTEDWKRFVDLYNNKQWPSVYKSEDRVTVNMIYALVSTAKPMLYFKNPRILVIPKKEEYRAGAEIAERALNYEWIEHRLKQKIKLCALDGLIIGHGWIKQVFDGKNIQALQISPSDMFADPMARNDWRQARFLIHRTFKSVEEVKKNPNYQNTKDLKPTTVMTEVIFGQHQDKKEFSDDVKRVEIWEIHDRENDKIRVLATGHEKWLRNEEHPYKNIEDYIFEMLRLIEIPDQFYPMSSIAPVESPCKELNKTRTQLINHRKRHKRIILYDKNVFTPDNLEDIEKSETLSLIPVDGLADPNKREPMWPVPDPPLGADVYQFEQIIKNDIREIYGQAEYQRSGQTPGVETATEAMMIERGARLRPDEMLDVIQDFCVDIAKKRLQMMKEFYTEPHMYRFADEMGAIHWGKFTKEDIQGEYDVDIEIASTMPWSEELRRKYNMDALNLLSNPTLQLQLQREGFEIKVSELVKGVLKDLRLPDTSRVLIPYGQGSPAPFLPGELEGGPMNVQKLQEKAPPNEGEAMRQGIARAGGVLGGTPGVGGR